ncbi:unnamed protein product [Rhizophagus irregularis]|nr:unnamed protein product [Rhizophagus irregularis]
MDSIDKESKLKEIKNNDIGIFRIHFGENDFNEIDEEEVDSKKHSSTKEAFVEELRCNNDNFLEIGLPPNNENLKDNFEITSEEYVEAEINRRNGFRNYLNF